MKVIRFFARLILAPAIFLIAGVCGTWAFVLKKDEMDDGRPATHDIAQVAPDEENDDRLRSHGKDQWSKDRTPLDRIYAVECAQALDAAEMEPNPVPMPVWARNRKMRRTG